MTGDTIVSLFCSAAKKYKDHIAFNYFDHSWKELTYGEFLKQTQCIASHLIKSGIKKGDRVAIISENRYEWCSAYLGILMSGGIAVPIDAQLGPREIKNLLDDSETVLLFHSAGTEENIKGFIRGVNFDFSEFKEISRTSCIEDYPEISEEDVASIVYTSGTTAIPKGVMLTHRNFCSDAESAIRAGIVNHEDNVFSILPLHHTYPFMCTFIVPLFLGARITYPTGLKGPELLSAMKEKGVTVLVAVPQLLELMRNGILRKFKETPLIIFSLLRILLKLCGGLRSISGINIGKPIFRTAHKAFGDRFRFFACGGARLDPQVMSDLEAIGFTVLEGYGLTETSPIVTFNPIEKRKPGSAGKPFPSVEIKITSPSETGEGEIAIRGPMIMKGYYKNPEATEKVMQDGWFLTGDLGYLDDENYLFITGRSKEVMVLSSGKNVYPEDVEKEYLRIPLIKEMCVSGIEEKGIVESLHGIIVPNLDYARKERIGNLYESLKWDINKVSLALPPYMRLKGFTLYSEPLPRTPLGKLKRYMIKDLIKVKEERLKIKEEDRGLMEDDSGRRVVECITPLLREKIPIHSSDNLELDLGLDSLQRIEVVVSIEKAFSIKLPEAFASEVQTVGELVLKIKEFMSKVIPEAVTFKKEVSKFELTEEDKKRVGLHQGKVEWAITVFLLNIIKLIFKFFFRLEVNGIDNLPKPPFIVVPNHCSNLDGFVIGSAVSLKVFRILHFQGFQTYFSGWWLPSLFGRLAHAIPIDPETFLSKAFQLSSYVLGNNRILCVFPEGGRSFDGNIMEFKKGFGILAIQHNVPVVPALIEGTFDSLPRGSLWPEFRKIRLTFGKPFHPSGLDLSQKPEGMDEYQFFANEVRERVRRLGIKQKPLST